MPVRYGSGQRQQKPCLTRSAEQAFNDTMSIMGVRYSRLYIMRANACTHLERLEIRMERSVTIAVDAANCNVRVGIS